MPPTPAPTPTPPVSDRPPRVVPRAAGLGPVYPSVSLLLPLGGGAWRQRLQGLRRVAVARLRDEFGTDVDPKLLGHLRRGVERAEPAEGARSLAVYADASSSHVEMLPIEVRERVVIDDTFATRDLVEADLRTPTYWVLALELDRPRLLRGRGERLRHHALGVDAPVARAARDRRPRGRDRSSLQDQARTRRVRAIDAALGRALADDDDPLVVVGAEPTLSRFLQLTRHPARIAAPLRRHPDPEAEVLARHVWPTVVEALADRRERALEALTRAVGSHREVVGIESVWTAAHRQRGALLLVERTYEQPARALGSGAIELVDDPTPAGVIDDAVDEVIEQVLGGDGRVEIVPDGLLDAQDRIALVTAPW